MPEIAKHETNMQEHRDEIRRFSEIVLRFDEVLSEKASKSEVKLFEQTVRQEYLSVRAIDDVRNSTSMNLTQIVEK